LDLLLATQGWRRFVVLKSGEDVEAFLEKHGNAAQRITALNSHYVRYSLIHYSLQVINFEKKNFSSNRLSTIPWKNTSQNL